MSGKVSSKVQITARLKVKSQQTASRADRLLYVLMPGEKVKSMVIKTG